MPSFSGRKCRSRSARWWEHYLVGAYYTYLALTRVIADAFGKIFWATPIGDLHVKLCWINYEKLFTL